MLLSRCLHSPLRPVARTTLRARHLRSFHTTILKMGEDLPIKKMVYFPRLDVQAAQSAEFRRVLWTGKHSQLVIMTVPVDGEIGEETHTVDQHLVFTSGMGKAVVAGEEQDVKAGDLVIVPAGTKHNFINMSPTPLILYTVYAPAEHHNKTVHKTREEGEEKEEQGLDEPPAFAKA